MPIETSGAASPVQPADPSPVPPSPVAAARAALDGFVNNKEWAAKYFAGDVQARQQFADLTTAIANAGDDVDAAIAGTATPPGMEVLTDGELPFRARMAVVEQMRTAGLNDATIAEAMKGEAVTKQEVEMARQRQAMRHSDKDWVAKLLAGDWQARKEQLLLSIILTNPVKE
jgi:hypothetical protein